MNNLNEKILDLLDSKDFNELSIDEKQLVYREIGEKAYKDFRASLIRLKSDFDKSVSEIEPDNELLQSLLISNHPNHLNPFAKEIKLKVLRLAAIFVVLLSGYPILLSMLHNSKKETVYVTLTDTLIVEKIVNVIDTVFYEDVTSVAKLKSQILKSKSHTAVIQKDTESSSPPNEYIVEQRASSAFAQVIMSKNKMYGGVPHEIGFLTTKEAIDILGLCCKQN